MYLMGDDRDSADKVTQMLLAHMPGDRQLSTWLHTQACKTTKLRHIMMTNLPWHLSHVSSQFLTTRSGTVLQSVCGG